MKLVANIECHSVAIRIFELVTAVLLLVPDTKYASITESKSESASFVSTNEEASK